MDYIYLFRQIIGLFLVTKTSKCILVDFYMGSDREFLNILNTKKHLIYKYAHNTLDRLTTLLNTVTTDKTQDSNIRVTITCCCVIY